MMGGGRDFSERNAFVLPTDQVPSARDLNKGLIIATCNRARFVDLKQLGVERSSVELEDEFSNSRSNG